MTLEGTLGRIGINLRTEHVAEEREDKFADDEYHVFVNTPVGWVEKREDGRTIITKSQLMELQSDYIGVPKPYVAQDMKDGTYEINIKK